MQAQSRDASVIALYEVLSDSDVIPQRQEHIQNINPFDISILLTYFDKKLNVMALETVPKDLRHLRACLLCSLVKVKLGILERNAESSFSANM